MKNLQPQIKLTCLLAAACVALAGTVLAVDPAPDVGYPNQNAAAGRDALFSFTTGADNTAMRFDARNSNTIGSDNALASWIWRVTGILNTDRNLHTATLLPNGMVLVAGGFDHRFIASASAELYDPASGTWTATGSLNTARGWHTATLLPNGLVLVAGGSGITGTSASAELYDPASGTWTATGSLNRARRHHTATLLQNGMVLVAGGLDTNLRVLASAELGGRHR